MVAMNTRIEFKDVSVRYPVRLGGRQRSVMAAVAATASFGRIAGDLKSTPYVEALSGVNLSVSTGDRVGIVGRNGSGKSTLLKTVAGHMFPSIGHLRVDGDVSALLSLSSGVNPDRTGRDNLIMMSRLLAIKKTELLDFQEDVLEFSELGQFFDLPIETYSAGMLVRYLFGAMTYRASEIMVVDEIIGAGDSFFFSKAQRRAERIFKSAKVLLIATHSREVLEGLCNRAIRIEQGKIVDDGSPRDVWEKYQQSQ